MKTLLSSKKFIQKIMISIIIMLLFTFTVPVRSQAGVGGIIMESITDFVGTICDVITGALQVFFIDGTWPEGESGLLNAFMVEAENFDPSSNEKQKDFAYNEGDGSSKEVIQEEDLDKAGDLTNGYAIPILGYTPQKILSGLVPAFDINFINPKDWNDTAMNNRSTAFQLHGIVASWYVALRNLAIVGLMSVLVYVGIRILITSTASDKAKYKQMLLDWFIAMCLLFCLHYIMVFTVTITQSITEAINGNISGNGNNIAVTVEQEGGGTAAQFNTDLMGLMRFKMQSSDALYKLLYMILYLAMIIYTIMFTWKYLQRTIMMAFLTLISPLVALTYPIDKLNDGKAQAFNMWLKEYIFNALLQPFHLIIYTIFVSSAIELATVNPIYAIVALAFITPAEKLLRKFFGFEKATTAGGLGSFAGGAMAYKMLTNAVNNRAKGNKNGGNSNIRTRDEHKLKDPDAPSGIDGFTGRPALSDDEQPTIREQQPLNKNQREEQLANRRERGRSLLNSNEQEEMRQLQQELDGADYNDMYLNPEMYQEKQARLEELQRKQQQTDDNARQEEMRQLQQELESADYNDMYLRPDYYQEKQARLEELQQQEEQNQQLPHPIIDRQLESQEGGQPPRPLGEDRRAGIDRERQQEEIPVPDNGAGSRPIRQRFKDGFSGAGKAIKSKAATTVGNKAWRGKKAKQLAGSVGKGIVHTGARVAATAAIGSLGVAAGIAGDDLGDVWKYGAGGIALGATTGGRVAVNAVDRAGAAIGRTGNAIGGSAPVQGFIEGFTGQTSTQRALERQKKDLVADSEFMQGIQQEYRPGGKEISGKELRKATERAADFYNYGITEPSKLAKALKAEDTVLKELKDTEMKEEVKQRLAKEQATTAMKMAEKIKDPNKLADSEYAKKLTDSWARTIQKKEPSLTQREAQANADKIMKLVRQIHKVD